MLKLVNYSKFILFALLVLVGIQAPGFVDDYGKNLASRFDESKLSLQPFQATAKQHFNGDLQKLIQHYHANQDPVVTEAGGNVSQLFERFKQLETSLNNFHRSSYNAYQEAFLKPLPEVQRQVWDNYNFQVLLNKESIVFGLVGALSLLILLEIIVWLLAKVFFRKPRAATNQ